MIPGVVPLSLATDIERIALAEVRMLRQAMSGDATAMASLLRPYEPGLWSICASAYPEEADGERLYRTFQDPLAKAVRHFVVERPVGLQLYGHLWSCLSPTLEPKASASPSALTPNHNLPQRSDDEDRGRILHTLHRLSPFDRFIWLFSAVTRLPAERLARLTQQDEARVVAARARSTWHLHYGLLT